MHTYLSILYISSNNLFSCQFFDFLKEWKFEVSSTAYFLHFECLEIQHAQTPKCMSVFRKNWNLPGFLVLCGTNRASPKMHTSIEKHPRYFTCSLVSQDVNHTSSRCIQVLRTPAVSKKLPGIARYESCASQTCISAC